MASKRSNQSVRSVETGATAGDFKRSQSITWQNKGGRNATTDESRRSAGGIAPKPSGGAAILGNDRPSAPNGASMARVKGASSSPSGYTGPAGSFNPVKNNANANLGAQNVGQAEVNPRGASARVAPQTSMPVTGNPVAATKPKRKGLGASFYGEY